MTYRWLLPLVLLAACGGDDGETTPDAAPDAAPDAPADPFANAKCADIAGTCMQVTDAASLQTAANTIAANTTIVLGAGTYTMTNSLTIRTDGAHLIGQGADLTILNYGTATAQVNGIDVIGDDFLVQDLQVVDSPKDGIRVEASDGVVYRGIKATWTTPDAPTNGGYGIYPVKSKHVLVENSEVSRASDAGLYVGQCQYVIVRNNHVTGNVAGLEIENTEYADVYNNVAEDNTAGIVVFDLPGNPIVGRDVRLRDNMIMNNNHVNFAAGGTVMSIPVGTGTFAMASRRVEIVNNHYLNNDTVDIAIISGLAIEQDTTKWTLPTSTIVGDYSDLALLPGADPNTVMNFRSENIKVAGNTHMGSGQAADTADPLQLGLLLRLGFGADDVSNVLYDNIGEPSFHSTDATMNSNVNHICVGGNTNGTYASLDLAMQSPSNIIPFFRPAAPFAPFDCTALTGGPVAEVILP